MNTWLLREIDELQSKIDQMGSPRDLSQEIRSIREEVNRIAGAGNSDSPIPPLYVEVNVLKDRAERQQGNVNSQRG